MSLKFLKWLELTEFLNQLLSLAFMGHQHPQHFDNWYLCAFAFLYKLPQESKYVTQVAYL